MARRKIAVVGSGVAGLTAAYVMQRDADVTLYEADDRLGGHADTHDVAAPDGVLAASTPDSSCTICAPIRCCVGCSRARRRDAGVGHEHVHLVRRLRAGVRRRARLSDLLPSVRTVVGRAICTCSARSARFYRRAHELLARDDDGVTVREFLAAGGFTPYFASHFVTPVIAAVWSMAPSEAGDYPARYLFTFLANHGALAVHGSPIWYTVAGGSARYVEQAARG